MTKTPCPAVARGTADERLKPSPNRHGEEQLALLDRRLPQPATTHPAHNSKRADPAAGPCYFTFPRRVMRRGRGSSLDDLRHDAGADGAAAFA
ncbi:hypothetical protein, partial [Paracoccus jeotgali]|uniref:hypothetical protein n=1 Tax=Paracoccus jeotgali TaxID=2065379 RepID=UPI0028AC880E